MTLVGIIGPLAHELARDGKRIITHQTVPSWLRARPLILPLMIASLVVVASIG
jgi:hypothetical protein